MHTIAYLASITLIFLIPWENSIVVSGFGTFTRAIGLIVAAIWMCSVLSTGVFRKFKPFHIIAFLFIMWNVASTFWSIDDVETIKRIITYVQQGILTCILWNLYITKKALSSALQAYVLGGFVLIFSTFYNYYLGIEISGRYAATGFNPNDLGLNLALGIPLAFYMILHDTKGGKTKWLQFMNYAFIPAAIVAIVLTASRGALLALMPALFYILVSLRRANISFRLFFTIITILFIFTLPFLIPKFNYQRLATIPQSIIEGDLGGRLQIWNSTIEHFERQPLLGAGSGALPSVHNVFLSVLAETGLIGFILFMLLFANVVYAAIKQQDPQIWLWLTVIAVWTVGAQVHNWEHRKVTWLILNFTIISADLFCQYKRKALKIKEFENLQSQSN